MPEVAALSVAVTADTSGLEAGLARANQQVQGFGSQLSSVGAAAGTALAGIGVAAVAGFGGAIKTAADFEKQISAIAAVSGEGEAGMERIRQTALQLGKDTSFSASEAAAGMEEIIKAGLSVEQVVGGAGRAVLDLSAASGTAVEESARIMSNALNTFKADNMAASDAANLLAGAANASATSVHELGYGLASVGNVAATLGLSFKDTSTALAEFAQNGLKGSDAGTSLKTMLLNLQPSTKAQREEFARLGLETTNTTVGYQSLVRMGLHPASENVQDLMASMREHLGLAADTTTWTDKQRAEFDKLARQTGLVSNAFFDENGKMKSLAEVSQILQKSLTGMTEQQKIATLETLFGTDAIRAAAILAKEGAEGFNAMGAAMEKQGDVQKIANERLNNLAGSWEKFTGSVETAAIIIGSVFLPALTKMVDGLTDGVNQGIDILEKLPDVWRTIGQVFMNDWSPSDAIDPFVNEVGKAALALKSQFGPAIEAVAGFLSQTLLPAVQAVGQFLADHTEIVLGFATALGSILAMAGVQAVLAGIAAAIGLLLSPLGLVTAAITVMAAAWIGNWGGIRDAVMPIIAQLVAIIQTALGGDIPAAFTAFLALLVTTGQQIVAQLLLWGQAFVDWIAPMIGPFMAAMAAFAAQFFAWIAAQIPPLVAQLLLWGQEFVAWVAPQIAPLLAALAALAAQLLSWIAAQIPPLIAALLTWGLEFVKWVAPQIAPMVVELGRLARSLIEWLIAQVPGITAELVKWGILFGAWVLTSAVPELVKALPQIVLTIGQWIGEASVEIAKLVLQLGLALAQGIWDGFTQAWSGIGPKIKESISGALQFNGGAGGPGATKLSYSGGSHAAPYMDLINQVSQESGVPADVIAAIMDTEGSGANSTSPAGAKGLMQVMPFHYQAGENPYDPLTSIRQGARVLSGNYQRSGNWTTAAGDYFGRGGPDAGGMVDSVYEQRFNANRSKYQGGSSPAAMQKVPLKGAGGSMAPMDGGPLPPFMQETFDSLPDYLKSLDTIQQLGTDTYTQVATVGKAQGLVLAASQTDALGNVTTTYKDAAGEIIATGTNASGQVTSQYAAMAGGVTLEMGNMAAGITTTQTELGNNLLTTVSDTAGNYVTTITTMSGQIVSQYAGTATQVLAQTAAQNAGVTTSYDLMAQGSLQHVQALADGTTATVSSASGVTITTITDMAGQVTSQYGTMASGATISMSDMATMSTTTTDAMAGTIKTTMTDMAGNVVTTVTDMHGQVVSVTATSTAQQTSIWSTTSQAIIATASQMGLQVIGQTRTMGQNIVTATKDSTGQMVTLVTDATGKVVASFKELADGGKIVASGMDVAKKGLDGAIKSMKDAESQAKKTAQAMGELGGKKGGDGNSKAGAPARAGGGDVSAGLPYLVGDAGRPELFVPWADGTILPSTSSVAGRGSSIDYDRLAAALARALPRGNSYTINGVQPESVFREARRQQERDELMHLMRS